MEADRDALLSCDVAGALPGGAQADDGTAWEIGHACAKGMPVTRAAHGSALVRRQRRRAVNAMMQGTIDVWTESGKRRTL